MARSPKTAVESQAGNPNLTNRLGRETGAIIVPFDSALPLHEQAAAILGDRFRESRMGFMLDGKPINTAALLKAAGLKFKDE